MEIKEAAWHCKLLSLQRWEKHISSAWDQQGDGHFPSGLRMCFLRDSGASERSPISTDMGQLHGWQWSWAPLISTSWGGNIRSSKQRENDGRGTAWNSPDVSTPQHLTQPSRLCNSSQLKYPKINAILPKKPLQALCPELSFCS